MNCVITGNFRQEQEIIKWKRKDISTWSNTINIEIDSVECGMFRNYAETVLAKLPQ